MQSGQKIASGAHGPLRHLWQLTIGQRGPLAAIGQVWNATFAPAAPAPWPSLRNQFSSSGLWPVACCIVPVFQSLPPWLGSGLWDQGFGFWALLPGSLGRLSPGFGSRRAFGVPCLG